MRVDDSLTTLAEAAGTAGRAPCHVDQHGFTLIDLIDTYASARLDREEALDLLAGWPYQLPRTVGQGDHMPDSFSAVEGAAAAGVLTEEEVREIQRRRAARRA